LQNILLILKNVCKSNQKRNDHVFVFVKIVFKDITFAQRLDIMILAKKNKINKNNKMKKKNVP